MRRTVAGLVLLLAAPAPALGQGTGPLIPAPPAPVAATPAPAPAGGRMTLTVTRTARVGGQLVALTRRSWIVRGRFTPYVAGQRVRIRVSQGSRRLRELTVAVRQAGTAGVFSVAVRRPTSGRIRVTAFHAATPAQRAFAARPVKVEVIAAHAGSGDRGLAVRFLQSQLAALHYAVSRSGRFDDGTGRAVIAYRKVNGMRRNSSANRTIFVRLAAGRGAFKPRYPGHGRHVEGDLTHQVLALIDSGGRVHRVYMLSSGKPSTPTILGHFHFYTKGPGYNAEGMYFSNYFIRGYAVHGYAEVPTYAASHGCLRVPIPNAVAIYRWIKIGMPIDVYYR